jgi:hypothetical protein
MSGKVKISAARTPVVASEFRFAGASERAVGANGEINAYDKRDLLNKQMAFLQASSAGQVMTNERGHQIEAAVKEHRELLKAAVNDREVHRVLGERMAESLYITANRQGFMRKYLAKTPVEQGSIPRFPLRTKNVTAVWSTSPTRIETQITRDKWYYPPELSIVTRPFVTQNELNQSSGDVLQEKYVEATEAVMVAEDRLWYNQVNAIVGVDNNLSILQSGLTPFTLMQLQTNVTRWGLKAPHVLIASDLYQDIVGNSEFYNAIDPVARHELLLTGELAVMYGMTITSDAYRHPEHKVLNQGELYVISEALNHGAYSDRGGINSSPIDIVNEKIPGKGWVIHEEIAISVANSRSVAKGIRL